MTPPPGATLHGLHVLVAEDDWFLAVEMEERLTAAGATVAGPVPSVEAGLVLLGGARRLDAAVLDVNLGGEMVFPLADRLLARGVPVVFATAYSGRHLPPRFIALPLMGKPVHGEAVAPVVAGAVRSR